MSAIPLLPWGLLLAALAAYIALVVALIVAGRRSHARAVAGLVPDCLILVKRLLADPATPRRHKLLLAGLFGYLASPLDLVPDLIPVAGQLDDLLIVALVLHLIVRSRGEAAIRAAWPGPEGSLRVVLGAAGGPSSGATL